MGRANVTCDAAACLIVDIEVAVRCHVAKRELERHIHVVAPRPFAVEGEEACLLQDADPGAGRRIVERVAAGKNNQHGRDDERPARAHQTAAPKRRPSAGRPHIAHAQSVLCVPSQCGLLPVRLQPQSHAVSLSSAVKMMGRMSVTLCEPSQKGWVALSPQAHQAVLLPGNELGFVGFRLGDDGFAHGGLPRQSEGPDRTPSL